MSASERAGGVRNPALDDEHGAKPFVTSVLARLTQLSRLLPSGKAVDVILNVDAAQKECQNAAQLQSDIFSRVVIGLHRGSDAENPNDVSDGARNNKQPGQRFVLVG